MKLMYAFISITFAKLAIYRLNFWTNIFSVLVTMYAAHSLWSILSKQNPEAVDFSAPQVVTFGVLGMLLRPLMFAALGIQSYVALQVRTGMIEMDIIKPLNFIYHMFCRNFSEFVVRVLTVGVPGFIFGSIFFDLPAPRTPLVGLAFIGSIFAGYLIFFLINFLVATLSFITFDIRSYTWIFLSIVSFASGWIVPIWIFPSPIKDVIEALPFQATFYSPLTIYTGTNQNSILATMLIQIGWIFLLLLLVNFLWFKVRKKISIQGG